MSAPSRYVDPASVGEFVEACDRAIGEVGKLEAGWQAVGDEQGVELAQRMTRYLSRWRQAALDGRLPEPSQEYAIGILGFTSEYDWGPHGGPFVEAAYEAERTWREMKGYRLTSSPPDG